MKVVAVMASQIAILVKFRKKRPIRLQVGYYIELRDRDVMCENCRQTQKTATPTDICLQILENRGEDVATGSSRFLSIFLVARFRVVLLC